MAQIGFRPLLAAAGIAAVLALAGCGSSGPEGEFLAGARPVAPANYDSDGSRMSGGRHVCSERQQGQPDGQIAESIVNAAASGFADTPPVSRAEVDRFVAYALQHCEYLLSPDAQTAIDEATLEYLENEGDELVENGVERGIPRPDAEAYVERQIAELRAKLGR